MNNELNSALIKTKRKILTQAALALIAICSAVVLCFALTVAWYSNILHTTDLTFKAESWDFVFEGNLTMGTGSILASPGDNGTIALSLANVSNEANRLASPTDVSSLGVNVTIDKGNLGLLSPRIYFYVDTQMTRCEETVDRIYLSSQDGYTYTVYPGHTLQLSDTYCNDYPIKWHWVYDVVGYYVKANKTQEGKIQIEEYVKPIEYNPDLAVYDDESKKLISINGKDVQSYLIENYLSCDGYQGSELVLVEGTQYYTINEAEGIYLYLCTKEEIDNNNLLDTALGTGQQSESVFPYTAKIMLTGQKAEENRIQIHSESDLMSALTSGNHVLELANHMTLSEAVSIPEKTEVVIDLNGYTLEMNQAITAQSGSSLGLINGVVSTDQENLTLMNVTSSEIYLDNLIIEGFYEGIEVNDTQSLEDTHIFISQCQIETGNSVVWLRGNGTNSARKTTLVIEHSTLTSIDYIPVGGNGSQECYGTDIQILSSSLKGKYAAVFQPMMQSTFYVKDSILTGDTGVAIKGGSAVFEDCRIYGVGANKVAAHNYNGFTDTGDALYIEDTYARNNNSSIDVEITGETTELISTNGYAIQIYEDNSSYAKAVIYDGICSSDVTAYLPKDDSREIKLIEENRYQIQEKQTTETSEE